MSKKEFAIYCTVECFSGLEFLNTSTPHCIHCNNTALMLFTVLQRTVLSYTILQYNTGTVQHTTLSSTMLPYPKLPTAHYTCTILSYPILY